MPISVPELTIPDDWDGETWECIQVRFPKSEKYYAILLGMLSQLTRGRAWKGTSGTITEAQEIGKRIFEKNWPTTRCTEAPAPQAAILGTIPSGIGAGGCADEICEDCEMGNCITDLKIEDGLLWMFKCCEWWPVGEIDMSIANLPVVDTEEEETNIACPIAFGMGTRLYELAVDCANAPYNSLPWNWAKYVTERNSDLPLDQTQVWKACGLVFAAALGSPLDWLDVNFTLTDKRQIICEWLKIVPQFSATITRELKGQMEGAVQAVGVNPVELEYKMAVFHAITLSGYQKIAQQSSEYEDAVCDCPDAPEMIPVEVDWIYDMDFREGAYGWEIIDDGEYAAGVGYRHLSMVQFDGIPGLKRQADADLDPACFVRYVKLFWASWPTTATHAAECGFQIGAGCEWVNPESWGADADSVIMNEALGNLEWVEINKGQATADPTSGDAILYRAIIAGNGEEPFSTMEEDDPPV